MTAKENECVFYDLMRRAQPEPHSQGPRPRDIINSPAFPLAAKQAWRYLEKWCARGWYEYGVALDLGWFTSDAPPTLREPE